MNDRQWEEFIQKAKHEDEALKSVPVKQADARLNVACALTSPTCLFIAFFLPSAWAELLVFSVAILGGLGSFGVLVNYAYTNNVSHKMKEAVLSFLLGNLLVFFVFVLKPT